MQNLSTQKEVRYQDITIQRFSITTLHANEDSLNGVTQGIPWEKLYPQLQQVDATTATAPSTKPKTLAREKEKEENGRGSKLKKEAAESRENPTLYLIMPGYAEAHKKEIKKNTAE